MAKMLELIRESAVPVNIMRSAAKGALALPASEMVEILVYLSKHPVFGQQARLTLAEWEEGSARAIAADASTPREVLEYMIAPENRRIALVPFLLDNPSVETGTIIEMAMTANDELATAMLHAQRVRASADVLGTLAKNRSLNPELLKVAEQAPGNSGPDTPWAHEDDILALDALAKFELEHKDEIAAEGNKPFRVFVPDGEAPDELAEQGTHATSHPKVQEHERTSTLQKIARLSVGERVQLAMKGNKDERFILIRDGSKVVCLAVLESPKLTDSEVEGFAAMKNVQEIVLRTIAAKRRFIKHYTVIKQLVNNPRTPLDVSLPLLSHLLVQDLKFLSLNKNVADTVRKLAMKLHKEKQSTRKG